MVIKGKVTRWYRWSNGIVEPMYELAKKSGNGMKAYTLREARELKLLPSVTSVLSVIDKPDLDNWRVKTAIEAAMTLPQYPDEGEDEYADRVLADAEAQANKAAEFGTRIHDAIAAHLTNGPNPDPDLVPFLMPFADWALENIEEVHAVEKCVGHPSIGVAGRMDLDCTLRGVGRTICDFKTQDVKDGNPRFWSDWNPQLSAYAECSHDGPNHHVGSLQWRLVPRVMSIVIPSNEPGPIHARLWTEEEQKMGWETFQAAFTIWRLQRDYDPRQP